MKDWKLVENKPNTKVKRKRKSKNNNLDVMKNNLPKFKIFQNVNKNELSHKCHENMIEELKMVSIKLKKT